MNEYRNLASINLTLLACAMRISCQIWPNSFFLLLPLRVSLFPPKLSERLRHDHVQCGHVCSWTSIYALIAHQICLDVEGPEDSDWLYWVIITFRKYLDLILIYVSVIVLTILHFYYFTWEGMLPFLRFNLYFIISYFMPFFEFFPPLCPSSPSVRPSEKCMRRYPYSGCRLIMNRIFSFYYTVILIYYCISCYW